jgi:hypothetical protein
MKAVVISIVCLWVAFWWSFAYLNFTEAMDLSMENIRFIAQEMKPVVAFVDQFHDARHRLPTQTEFYRWTTVRDTQIAFHSPQIRYIRAAQALWPDEDLRFPDLDFNHQFLISVSKGKWTGYYYSGNAKYDTGIYSMGHAYAALCFNLMFGVSPLLLVLFRWFKLNRHQNFPVKRGK